MHRVFILMYHFQMYFKDIRRTLSTSTNRSETYSGNITRRTRESDKDRSY